MAYYDELSFDTDLDLSADERILSPTQLNNLECIDDPFFDEPFDDIDITGVNYDN